MRPVQGREPRGAARQYRARCSSAEVKELPSALHGAQPRYQEIEVGFALDEVEILRVDDQHGGAVVMIKEARIALDEQLQILLAHGALVAARTPAHALNERRGLGLQINDQIGRRRARAQRLKDLLVERKLVR